MASLDWWKPGVCLYLQKGVYLVGTEISHTQRWQAGAVTELKTKPKMT